MPSFRRADIKLQAQAVTVTKTVIHQIIHDEEVQRSTLQALATFANRPETLVALRELVISVLVCRYSSSSSFFFFSLSWLL